MRIAFALAIACVPVLLLGPPSARADEPLDDAGASGTGHSESSAKTGRRDLELGVQLYGGPNGSFLDEPPASKKGIPKGTPGGLYPGFAGVGGGGGLSVVGMWRGIVGLDIGFHVSLDQGHGEINGIELNMNQVAVHVPILLRVAAPYRTVRPFLFVGPEIVAPLSPKIDLDPALPGATLASTADTYVAVAFGFGFDIRLPTDKLDVRIPLMLRGSYTPSVSDYVADRVTPGGVLYTAMDTTWQYQAMVTLGVAIYFL
ncbi:MAG: hypothetical protein H6744_10365 [Deltaproteobacteria bacterium]|nr:hypothetical protein [Deltaproteobacteria bacterium]MCB9787081.1 hypothetical protein [Deltaproteobacteria bacterium]